MRDITIGILNMNRYDVFKATIESLCFSIRDIRDKVHLILWDNGSSNDIVNKIIKDDAFLFDDIKFSEENVGIGGGIAGLYSMIHEDSQYYMHLENDWICTSHDSKWLSDSLRYLEEVDRLGIIKLRQIGDGQYEMAQHNYPDVAKLYSPWWVQGCKVERLVLDGCSEELYYDFVERGYTNNPHVANLKMTRNWKWDTSVKGYGLEEEKTEILPKIQGWKTGQLGKGFFKHIG